MTKQKERRRRQRQRRRERKEQQQNGSEQPIDGELATQMQVWAVHEPKQTKPEERCEPEELHAIDEVIESMLASLAEDRTDC